MNNDSYTKKSIVFDKVNPMHDVNKIVEDFIIIDTYEKFNINKNKFYKIVNINSINPNKNNSHFIVKGSHIEFRHNSHGKNEISLNRKQRALLNIQQFKDISDSSLYKIKIEEFSNNLNPNYGIKNPNIKILNIFVGKKNILLTVKRPYSIDENFNLVRISSNNMKILGLSNMDRVILTYGNNSLSVNALENSDLTSFKASNYNTLDDDGENFDKNIEKYKILDENYCILVPIHIRQKLFNLSYDECRENVIYNSGIKVSRDNYYIFMKGFYKQLIPIALAIFGIVELIPAFVPAFHNKILLAIVSLFAAILTLYINLAEERNICK